MKNEYFKYTGGDSRGKVIAGPTAEALKSFCRQEPEFDQAVEQSGKTFNDCIKSVLSGIGSACSDLEVFKKAVRFYFPGADIRMSMTINMSGDVEAEHKASAAPAAERKEPAPVKTASSTHVAEPKKLTLDLDDFLDF